MEFRFFSWKCKSLDQKDTVFKAVEVSIGLLLVVNLQRRLFKCQLERLSIKYLVFDVILFALIFSRLLEACHAYDKIRDHRIGIKHISSFPVDVRWLFVSRKQLA